MIDSGASKGKTDYIYNPTSREVVAEQKRQSAADLIAAVAKAREATEAVHARMLAELKQEVGRLVVDTTSKVAGKVLTAEDQQRLIQETNKEIAA